MLNKELYAEKLKSIRHNFIGVNFYTNEPKDCKDMRCDTCLFYTGLWGDCKYGAEEWLNQEAEML